MPVENSGLPVAAAGPHQPGHQSGRLETGQFGCGQIAVAGESPQVDATGGNLQLRGEGFCMVRAALRSDESEALRRRPPALRTLAIQHRTAADRASCRLVAQNDRVSAADANPAVEHQLCKRPFAGHQWARFKQRDPAWNVGRSGVDVNRRPVA